MVLLKEQYGKQVVVNLLGSRGGEEVLNRAFKVTGPLPRVRPSEEVGGGLLRVGFPGDWRQWPARPIFGETFFLQSFSIK